MIARAPVTLAVAMAAALCTLFLGQAGLARYPGASWLIHTELAHLLSDLIPWIVLGLWLEPRSGSPRWAMWTALAAAFTTALHGVTYPHQSAVYGLSAVVHAVAFAGLIAWRGGPASDPRRWAVLLLLTGVLVDELLHGKSAWRTAVTSAGRSIRFVPHEQIETTPLLHAAAAIMGALLGLSLLLGSGRDMRFRNRRNAPLVRSACR